jgi:hypothetical protein
MRKEARFRIYLCLAVVVGLAVPNRSGAFP